MKTESLVLGVLVVLSMVATVWLVRWIKRDYARRGEKGRQLEAWGWGRDTEVGADAVASGAAPTAEPYTPMVFSDGDRYRWLRARPVDAVHMGGLFVGKVPDNVVINGDDLDAAVDQAMWDEVMAEAKS